MRRSQTPTASRRPRRTSARWPAIRPTPCRSRPDCTRIEVGLKTGFSGNHLRRSLNGGLQYKVIKSVTAPEFTVDGDTVRARFDLSTKPTLAGRRVGAHIDETFLIPADDPSGGHRSTTSGPASAHSSSR